MIFGASGGVGHLAVQLAKRLGARVFAVASGEDGVALAERLGADQAVNGRTQDVTEAARAFAPEGLDAALSLAGGDALEKTLLAVKDDGRVAYPEGVMPEPEARPEVTVQSYNGLPGREVFERLNGLIEGEPFEVYLAQAFPLEQVVEAHGRLNEHFLGKLVLRLPG